MCNWKSVLRPGRLLFFYISGFDLWLFNLLFRLCFCYLWEEQIEAGTGHFSVIFCLIRFLLFKIDHTIEICPFMGLEGIDSLSFMSLVDFELFIAAFSFDFASCTFVTHLTEFECNAAFLYLLLGLIAIFFKLLQERRLHASLFLLVLLTHGVLVTSHDLGS